VGGGQGLLLAVAVQFSCTQILLLPDLDDDSSMALVGRWVRGRSIGLECSLGGGGMGRVLLSQRATHLWFLHEAYVWVRSAVLFSAGCVWVGSRGFVSAFWGSSPQTPPGVVWTTPGPRHQGLLPLDPAGDAASPDPSYQGRYRAGLALLAQDDRLRSASALLRFAASN
jgi:hypothetical protein